MTLGDDRAVGWFMGLVAILSLPFYVLGATRAALPSAPALPISALMACVPAIAAMALVARHHGAQAAIGLFASTFRLRGIPNVGWVLLAIGIMPAGFFLTGGALCLSGSNLPALTLRPASAIIPAFALFFLGAVTEEIGWQGFVFPRLRKAHSALSAAVLIGVVWALWHVVPFALMGHGAGWIFWQGMGMVLMRIIIVWLVTNAGQSIAVAVLFHMMSNSVWGLFANFDPYYSPALMCLVLLLFIATGLLMWVPTTLRRRCLHLSFLVIVVAGIVISTILRTGLPMRALTPTDGGMIGAANDVATDPTRPDLFSGAAHRVIPFQILYPAIAPGTYTPYMPDARPQIDAIIESHGWLAGVLLGQIGTLSAPWTDMAKPLLGGPFPVIIYLPGVTGYMQMGSFQTTELATHGYIVVTLNQPGAVAAVVAPDHKVIIGLTRQDAAALIAPAYRKTGQPLPKRFAERLAPQTSIVPYFAADVPTVIDRLAQINADPGHLLHGLLDLDHIGVMGMSLGAIVTAQACAIEPRVGTCLMMDAPVPTDVASVGLRQPALWISRPAADQRLERAASGGWPEDEIDAQATTIAKALANSDHGQLVLLHGLFHIDFTDVPAIQAVIGWLGQSGPTSAIEAYRLINQLTLAFFAKAFAQVVR